MEIKHMHVMVALTIIFLIALGFFLEQASKPPGPTPEEIAQTLLYKAVSIGENVTSYSYTYTEYSDGFPGTHSGGIR